MTDPLRKAAQALVDASFVYDPETAPLIDALRAALASPAPSTSRDDALAADHALAPVAVEGMIRDAALDEAARLLDMKAPRATTFMGDAKYLVLDLAEQVRSLKGQPAAPADQSKETPHE